MKEIIRKLSIWGISHLYIIGGERRGRPRWQFAALCLEALQPYLFPGQRVLHLADSMALLPAEACYGGQQRFSPGYTQGHAPWCCREWRQRCSSCHKQGSGGEGCALLSCSRAQEHR